VGIKRKCTKTYKEYKNKTGGSGRRKGSRERKTVDGFGIHVGTEVMAYSTDE
jgi:hypothetical protein